MLNVIVLKKSIFPRSTVRTIHTNSALRTEVFSTKSVNLNKTNLSIVPWGVNLESGLSFGRLSSKIRNMYELPDYQSSVLVGILLSYGW